MSMRVATFANSEQMIAAALRTQATMANQQIQESSGLVSSEFGGYGATAQHVINLEVSVSRSQSYIDQGTQAGSKIEVMYSTVGSVADVLTKFRALLTAASNTLSTNSASVTESAQGMLTQLTSLLNTQYSGKYLFGGAQVDTAPVDLTSSSYTAPTTPSTANTGYYQGDSELASVRVSDTRSIGYGVGADNPAFEQAVRAINLVASNAPLTNATLTEALGLATTAVDAVGVVQSGLSNAASSIQTAVSIQTDYQAFTQTQVINLTSVDVAAVTAQLSTYQAQLTASYSAIAKIQGLSLANYLK
jgi:flagellar hook-associated protein 3 FlgL